MERIVEPELLDSLSPSDPPAIAARRGLRRVNAFMGNARTLSRALQAIRWPRPVRRLVDLGAGDGSFTWKLARRLAPRWPNVTVELIDQQDLLTTEMRHRFHRLGWSVEVHKAGVDHWLSTRPSEPVDLMIANLFLHHFTPSQLRSLLEKIEGRTHCFAACDPLRSEQAVRFCPWLRFLGCNSVVRYDAAVSIRAGFVDRELTALWPNHNDWQIEERQAGLFSHFFLAERRAAERSVSDATV